MEKSTDINPDVVACRVQVKLVSPRAEAKQREKSPMYIGYFSCAPLGARLNTRKSHDFSKQQNTSYSYG
jgi:hypothetical protein